MKKVFSFFLILIFVFGITSASFKKPVSAQANTDSKTQKTIQNFQKINKKTALEKGSANYVPGEILVKFKNNKINLEKSAGREQSRQFATNKNLDKKEDIRKSNISVLKTGENESVENAVERLKNDPDVEYVQPNYIYYPSTINTNDPDKDKLWGLDNTGQTGGATDADIDAPEAWNISEGDKNKVIAAVIDTGVAYNHPDLAANMWDGSNCVDENGGALGGCIHGYDFENEYKSPLDTNGHGTHVAGTIGALKNNSIGIIGVAPNVEIMAIKSGSVSFLTADLIQGINFAKQNGAKIINASWGGSSYDPALYNAIKNFSGLFIAAAGNDSSNNDFSHFYPSDYDLANIISVAATDKNDGLASFSNYGATSVDVGAPGEDIYSTYLDSTYAYKSGTSMAAPHVAGLAGLIWGYKPELSSDEVKNTILFTGDPITSLNGKTASEKRINAYNALSSLVDTTPPFVVASFPTDNSTNISISAQPYLEFSEALNPSTIIAGNVELRKYSDNTRVLAFLLKENNNKKIVFNLIENLNYETQYYFFIGTGVKDIEGNSFLANTWYANQKSNHEFTTEAKDITSPTVTEITPISTFTNDNTPDYTFNTTEAGKISYSDGCSSATAAASAGNDTITFNQLADGTYGNCAITVTDSAGNKSKPLIISEFTIDTILPILGNLVYTKINGESKNISPINNEYSVTINSSEISKFANNLNGIVYINIDGADLAGKFYVRWVEGNQVIGQMVYQAHANNEQIPVDGWYFVLAENIAAPFTVGQNTFQTTFLDEAYNETKATLHLTTTDTTAPVITLLGENPVNLAIGDTYTDAGATATDNLDDNITANIAVVNPVNTSAAGIYTITYNVMDSAGNPATEVKRTVNVSQPPDTTAPVITLIGGNVNIYQGTVYVDAGATALDNLDGDITANIITTGLPIDTSTLGAYAIHYNVSDSSGNKAIEMTRTVNVVDTTAPVITLIGGDMKIYKGTAYTELGAVATDNVDAEVKVNIYGDTVDTATVGNYIVTYNASDSSGNKATEIKRTILVFAVTESQTVLADKVNLETAAQEILIGSNAPVNSTITAPSSVANGKLNVSALLSGASDKSVNLQTNITIQSATSIGDVNVNIPAGQINSNSSWTGIINLPQVKENSSVSVTPDSDHTASVLSVIEIGFDDMKLNFDKAVRIKINGQANKDVGYTRNGVFTKISNVCSADTQEVGDALTADSECKINVGSDLVIWTKHFTKFITYTQTKNQPAPAPVSSGGSGYIMTYNPVAPRVIINNAENITFNEKVSLELSANYMNDGYSPLQMMISNNSNFDKAEWINFAASTVWTLNGANGVKTIYVKFKNRYGESAPASDYIELVIKQNDKEITKIETPEKVKPIADAEKPALFQITQLGQPKILGAKNGLTNTSNKLTSDKKPITGKVLGEKIDKKLAKKLKGKLLLQVEKKGNIWYVDTIEQKRYNITLKNALPVFRKLSLGISNKDLTNIPISENDQIGNTNLRNRVKGKLLLQTEQKGDIWYVDNDGYRHLVTSGNLMELFRKLSLGISNTDLAKIPEGNLSRF